MQRWETKVARPRQNSSRQRSGRSRPTSNSGREATLELYQEVVNGDDRDAEERTEASLRCEDVGLNEGEGKDASGNREGGEGLQAGRKGNVSEIGPDCGFTGSWLAGKLT